MSGSHDHECGPDCLGPDYIERMERGLAGPFWTIPRGLSVDEIVQYMNDCAAGKIPPDTFTTKEQP